MYFPTDMLQLSYHVFYLVFCKSYKVSIIVKVSPKENRTTVSDFTATDFRDITARLSKMHGKGSLRDRELDPTGHVADGELVPQGATTGQLSVRKKCTHQVEKSA